MPVQVGASVSRIALIGFAQEDMRTLSEHLRRFSFAPFDLDIGENVQPLKGDVVDGVVVSCLTTGIGPLEELLGGVKPEERAPVMAVVGVDELAYYLDRPADDFVMWPVRDIELAARLRLLIRRYGRRDDEHILSFGELTIDLANYRVTVASEHVPLTFKEYELLRFLASNRDRVFSREALLSRVWGYDYFGGARTVDVHIRRLRAKIEDGHRTFIETIRNVGYRFKES